MGIGTLRRYHNIASKIKPEPKPVVEVPDGTFTDKTKRLDHFRTDQPVKQLERGKSKVGSADGDSEVRRDS